MARSIAATLNVPVSDVVDEQAIVAGALAGMTQQAIAAAIPAELAQQVADLLAARLTQ